MTKAKYKHGRKGVRRYQPRVPLSEQERSEVRRRGKEEGYALGRRATKADIAPLLDSLLTSKNIREVRRRIESWRGQ